MSVYKIGLVTGFAARTINALSTLVLTRVLPVDVFGVYALVQSASQSASSLFRLGTNYSYTVLLPEAKSAKSVKEFTATYIGLGLVLSIPFTIIISSNTAQAVLEGLGDTLNIFQGISLVAAITVFIFGEATSELFWSVLLPRTKTTNIVLMRDPVISAGKLVIPVILYVAGDLVLFIWGLTAVILASAISALITNKYELLSRVRTLWQNIRIGYAILLLKYGSINFVVPLVSNLVMLPLLFSLGTEGDLTSVAAIRVGSWGAQLTTTVGGSLAPLLLINNSRQGDKSKNAKRITQICLAIYLVIFTSLVFSWGWVNSFLLGAKYNETLSLQIVVIAGASLQSTLQILLQDKYRPKDQLALNMLQSLFTIFAYLVVQLNADIGIALKYALIPIISSSASLCVILSTSYFIKMCNIPDCTRILSGLNMLGIWLLMVSPIVALSKLALVILSVIGGLVILNMRTNQKSQL